MQKVKIDSTHLDQAPRPWDEGPFIISHRPSKVKKSAWLQVPSRGLHTCLIMCLVIMIQTSVCSAGSGSFYLEGIGYREQALQQAKGASFESEAPNGINYASFGGDTHIFIKGGGLETNPQSNYVFLYSYQFEQEIMAPLLTEDDAFNSHPILGSIAYRLPAIDKLFGVPISYLSGYTELSFKLHVVADNELGPQVLECRSGSKCMIYYRRHYTPVLYFIKPPIVYYESYVEMWFDPRSTQNLISELENDEMRFVNAKVGPALLDFEFNVDDTTSFSSYHRNKITGQVGEIPTGQNFNISMLWETGQSLVQPVEALHCTFDNQTCYQARSVPVIFDQSYNTGYRTGGQNLTVTGYGFRGDIKATVDGVNCTVTRNTDFSFSCTVDSKPQASDLNSTFVGSNGLKRVIYNHTGGINWNQLQNYNSYQKLALSMESGYREADYICNQFKGWFIPPATTRYRFYQHCDDYCRIYFSNVTGDSTQNVTLIKEQKAHTNFRNWYDADRKNNWDNGQKTEWINLTAGEPYYIEAQHYEGGGGDSFGVGLEIEATPSVNTTGHHHNMREVQYIGIKSAQVFDTTKITITNPDNKKYLLIMSDVDLDKTVSDEIPADASASTLKNAIKKYYSDTHGSGINVNKTTTMYDSNGTVTTNATNATDTVIEYYIVLTRLINEMSVTGISVIKSSTKADINITLPVDLQLSAKPLSGNFKVKCVDSNNVTMYSSNLHTGYRNNENWLAEMISRTCKLESGYAPFFDVLEAEYQHDFSYRFNGFGFYLRFLGMNSDPGQFEIVAGDDLDGTNITFWGETVVPYSDNLFYEALPFEFIRTFEEKPQLIVTVDDVPAVCHNLTCNFTYTEPVGEVTGYSYNDITKRLTLEGTSLPNVTANISSVYFALTHCTIDEQTVTNETLECILDEDPTCGDHLPVLTSTLGVIPNAANLVPQEFLCTLNSIFPSTTLNLLGGDNITLSGSLLPKDLSTSTVMIKFNDTNQTECVPQISSTDQLVCLTSPFDPNQTADAPITFDVVINSKQVSHTLATNSRNDVQQGKNLNPPSVSPVLKTPIEIQIDTNFPYTLNKNDFSVNASSIVDPSYIRYMNVIAVNDTAKTITVMFGGAESKYGPFKVWIRHAVTGLIESNGLILDVNAYVDSYSPKVGSIYGGTLLTIQGRNFGTEITDNPVQISTNGGVDSIDCYLQYSTPTEIKCRVDTDIVPRSPNLGADMVVFLKTSEEATCDPSSICDWVYTDQIPQVTNISSSFDNSSLSWIVKVEGTDFTGSTGDVSLEIANVAQTTTSISATEAIFTINNVTSQSLASNKLFFTVGLPKNHSIVETPLGITPRLVSVSPRVGSIGGTVITAIVPGATKTMSKGIYIKKDGSSRSICDGDGSATVVSYGVIQCKTKADEIWTATELVLTQGSDEYRCMNPDITQCQFEQMDDGSFPAITGATISDAKTITFTGTAFDFSNDYAARAEFQGIQADTVTVVSATSVTASFTLGVPISINATNPILSFLKANSSEELFAKTSSDLTNALSVTGSSSSLTCSFAGGCEYEVTSNSLAIMMSYNQTSNYIQICDEVCVYNESASSSTQVKCNIPEVSTIYSNDQFSIATESEDLDSGVYFGTSSDNEVAFDGVLTETPDVPSGECSIGMQFKENHVGMISQVKWFMGEMDASMKAKLVDITQFQGSQDGTTFSNLFTIDENLHSGWNYHKWNDTTPTSYPKFRFYRFYGPSTGACDINEITFTGVETIDNEDSTYTCQAKLMVGTDETVLNTVEYRGDLTTTLLAISPRFGTVVGGTPLTFTGTNFPTDTNKYRIVIDGIVCPVDSASSTSVSCTTGSRPGLVESSLEIFIQGQGLVSTNDLLFRYVSVWSSDTTWGGEFAPMDGESIYIPAGLNLLVDIDSSPHLKAVIVEGSLIFAPDSNPNHERFFDANYIFVNGGLMEVGTEEFPYTSKITITMHSLLSDPYLPIYGNKVIGVRYGTLDMHGIVRNKTWTLLEQTVEAGGTVIQLQEAVDWQPGEMVAIASTSFNSREGEHRTIKSIDSTRKILTLDQALEFKHFAETQYFGDQGEFIDMRAEVGLLSRNVVYRGDPETSPGNQYGATIFLHSNGDDSLTCRLSYIELTDVGQAFKIGRYAVHFHMIGAVHNSYAKGLGTHQGNNRAFTIHGTHYLRLENNVAYEVKGHTIFIEDAVETNSYVKDNLIIKTKRSWSLLNTDQTPACFWITHPNNIFIGNHAAGSDRYGFWYDLQTHAMGPSANQDVCPENDRVGEFRGNSAHSMGRYGLRIFHNMVPRQYPCKPLTFDHTNPSDPYWKNPPITANFDDFVGWKNNRNGAIAERVGDVHFNNMKTADNILAGIEFSLTGEMIGEYSQINGALVIGRTNNTDYILDEMSPHGIITSRKENFYIKNVRFYNFDWNNAAALGTCSHCFHDAATDEGARTITVSGLWFDDATVPRRIRYQTPFKAIFKDLDGGLTGLGANSWATFYYRSHLWDGECFHEADKYNGVICNSNVELRTIKFSTYKPSGMFDGMGLKVLQYDQSITGNMNSTELQEYIDDRSNYGSFNWKYKPSKNWAQPFVTGHAYKISWGVVGLDFEEMNFEIAQPWEASDKSVYLIHNFTDVRAGIEVKDRSTGALIQNDTIDHANFNDIVAGQNLVLNDTETREFHVVINGKNKTYPEQVQKFQMKGVRCYGNCNEEVEIVEEIELDYKLWSDPSNWPNNTCPQNGDDVMIESGWNMIFDLNETETENLIFNNTQINGKLSFMNETNIHFKVRHLFVRYGQLEIGNETHPFNGSVKITLYGEKNFEHMAFDNAIEAGNKIIANVGTIKMYGQPRTGTLTRLNAECFQGQTEIYVDPGLDWVAGDRIALGPTSFVHDRSEDNFVESYDINTGKTLLRTALKYHHWGAEISTADNYNGVDMRGEVILLSRSIVIAGEDIESWGGQIVTSDTVEFMAGELQYLNGQTFLDNVELYNCSQWDTYKAAIRFEKAVTKHSSITNCAIHNGLGWGLNIMSSANIHMKDNVFYDFRPVGIAVDYSKNITLDGNVLMRVLERTSIEADGMFEDKRGGFAICSYHTSHSACSDLKIKNNIATGVTFAGFIVPGDKCGETNYGAFYNNVGHSSAGTLGGYGALIYPRASDPSQSTCYEGSHFASYKNYYMGAFGFYNTKEVRFHHMTSIDNREGFGASLAINGDAAYKGSLIMLNDNHIYGESEVTDCPSDGSYCKVIAKSGFLMSGMSEGGKDLMPQSSSALPVYKIKSIGSWGGMQRNYRNKFFNFKSSTQQGAAQRLIALNKYMSDYHPMVEFYDSEFTNVDGDAFAYLMPPPAGWANIKDCGEFPCTAPLNALLTFENTQFFGSPKPSWATKDFQIISNNTGFSPYIEDCKPIKSNNAYVCTADKLGILLFESEDDDKVDRSLQPIYVAKQGTDMSNKLNSMMDHVWDGFYSGQIRMSRFGSLFEGSRRSVYDLTFTGTPAKKMRFMLNGLSRTMGATIRIAYPSAESRSIMKDGNIVEMNQWDDSIQGYGEIRQSFCGENRYIGVQNILEFYITANCTLFIRPRDAIQTLVRMEWTMDEFFADGGTTKFVDRLTGSLGIHASQVKIVSVYEGSLVVNYEVEPAEGQTLDALEEQQTEAFSSGTIDLGAPVLEFKATVKKAEDTPGSAYEYEPVTLVNGEYVQNNIAAANDFNPNIDIQVQETTNYNNVTVQIENDPNTVYQTQTQTVVVDVDPEVIHLDKEKDPFVIIVPIALSVIVVIVGAITCRYCLNRKSRELMEAETRAKRAVDFKISPDFGGDKEHEREMAELDKMKVNLGDDLKNNYGSLPRDSFNPSINVGPEEYEAQYDPNNDFAIFGTGDPTRGGVQSLQEKMNLADGVKEADSSSDDDESHSAHGMESNKTTQVNSGSNGARTGSADNSQNSSSKMLNVEEENKLPEDKEIHSDNEEEEEE